MDTKKVIGIVLAGGSGTRFKGNVPKQYCLLAGKEVISYSIEAFRKAAFVDEVIVIVDAKEFAEGRIAETYGVTTVLGGNTRNASFGNALAYIRENFPACTKIIENNAACPLIQPQQIDAMVALLDEYDYVQSTFKITDALGSYSSRTVDREDYFLIQAPDAYRFPLLDSCFDAAHSNGHPAVQLPADATGYNYFIEGQPFKITYPDDLEIAEILLRRLRQDT